LIELENVYKTLGGRQILGGLSLVVPDGQNYVLMGRSGIGKSVTLKHIIGIFKPDRGKVIVDGLNVAELDRKGLMQLRRRMGYLFQNGALINWLSVFENVALPLREHSQVPPSEVRRRVMGVLEVVGMAAAAEQFPPDISGGMKLRAGLARALVTDPEYVLYDEPNAGLDPVMADQIHRLIVEVRDRMKVTGLVVTHSRACAFAVADRIGVIDNGAILAEGPTDQMRHSSDPLVHAFLSGGAD